MDQCLRVLDEEKETELDSLLVFQIKCQIITNQLNNPPATDPGPVDSSKAPSPILIAALTRQLRSIQKSLPAHIQSTS